MGYDTPGSKVPSKYRTYWVIPGIPELYADKPEREDALDLTTNLTIKQFHEFFKTDEDKLGFIKKAMRVRDGHSQYAQGTGDHKFPRFNL